MGHCKAFAVALTVAGLSSPNVFADRTVERAFSVLLNGVPAGDHVVRYGEEGDRIIVDVETHLNVRIATVPVYEFDHERREVWSGGRPLSVRAQTKNGASELTIEVRRTATGLIRAVNGREDRFDGTMHILSLWNRDILNQQSFVSVVEDKILAVRFSPCGQDTFQIDGRTVSGECYRMHGDEERLIWYDPDGQVVLVRFWRQGATIDFVRADVSRHPVSEASSTPTFPDSDDP